MDADPRIVAAIPRWKEAPHGGKSTIVKQLADELGISYATVYRRLDALAFKRPRKRRSDADSGTLTEREAALIWAAVRETTRQTGTGSMPVMEVVEMLRADGRISAARIDKATGEWLPLSESAIRRSLRGFGYTTDLMTAPSAASRLSSPHPNHCWQIDASVSRQFYLADDGMQQMSKAVFYRGKPGNFSKINERRIWRYCVTDHASGCVEVFYVQGAESAANVIATLIHVMTRRSGGTMHGVPRILMSDPGSGMVAQPVENFLQALGVRHLPHMVGNARVTGQVENAHYLVERHFEAGLKFAEKFTTIEQINTLAQEWARAFNATRIHSRTGMTRRDGWLRITPQQLVLAPSVEVLRTLPNSAPKSCTVRDCMIRYGGVVYDVRDLPGGIVNGQKLVVVRNALDDSCVRVVLADEEGKESHYLAPRLDYNAFGFVTTAAEIGTEFKSMPESPADVRNKALERLAMDAASDADAAAARKAKRLAFGGTIDPMKHLRVANAAVPDALPRAGTSSTVEAAPVAERRIEHFEQPRFTAQPLGHVELAQRLRERLPDWSAQHYAALVQGWPQGATEDELDAIARRLPLLVQQRRASA